MWGWRTRLLRLLRPGARGVLSPAEGYRLWASTYGREPNDLQKLEAPALERLLPDVAGRRVLDLGCGRGRVARLIRRRGGRAVAADLAPAMLSRCDAISTPKLIAAADRSLPFREASFDTVVCALVLGHVEHLGDALSAIAGVLRSGGYLVISDFHPYATLRGWERTFVDPEGGATWAIAQHLHLFSDYIRELGRSGYVLEALTEPRWRGSPVVFVLRARLNRTRQ